MSQWRETCGDCELAETERGREYRTLNLPMPHRTRRFILLETDSSLPEMHLWYPTGEVVTASRLFLDSIQGSSLTYRYDLVDLTRQVLSKLANQVYLESVMSYREKNASALDHYSHKFLQLPSWHLASECKAVGF
ncbi:hypothetical protein Droror1_Dr00027441 [Drosera rotundifolia]